MLNVPVGGVDNLRGQAPGWKMEAVFKMTEEQVKAAETLRTEYAADEKKLEQEIREKYTDLADKMTKLRQKYEQRANDILTDDDKQRKEKLDALARDTNAKNAAVVKELLPLYDLNDMQQRMGLVRAVREKVGKNTQQAETQLLDLVPPESREKIEAAIREQNQARDAMNRWGGGGQQGGGVRQGGGGRRQGGGNQPVRPPQPPEADKKLDF